MKTLVVLALTVLALSYTAEAWRGRWGQRGGNRLHRRAWFEAGEDEQSCTEEARLEAGVEAQTEVRPHSLCTEV